MPKLYLFLLLFPLFTWAQKPIETDRPDQTETAATVPAGKFQFETGFLHKNNEEGNEFELPETLWKYGINNKVEIRLITSVLYEKMPDASQSGLAPVTLGFKAALWRQKGILPQISLMVQAELPKVATKELKENYVAPEVRLLFMNKVNPDIILGYNVGAEWDGQYGSAEYSYTLAPDFKLGSRLSAFVEIFGFMPEGHHADHWTDGGFKYLITNNIQVDFSCGYELSSHNKHHGYFESAGVSFRL